MSMLLERRYERLLGVMKKKDWSRHFMKSRGLASSQRWTQRIIAMLCGPPPQGTARWSVRLIAEEAAKRELAPHVGRETIRILLQNHELKPWREKKLVYRGTQ